MAFRSFFICALITVAEAHSQMTVPPVRALRSEVRYKGMNPLGLIRPDGFHPKPGQQLKVGSDNFLFTEDDFACRGGSRGKPTATLTAGSNYNIKIKLYAPHPGDFAMYASYDTDDTTKDVNKKWYLIYKQKEALCCKCNDPASMCACDFSWVKAKGKNVCAYTPGPTARLDAHPTWDSTCSRGCEQDRTITVPIPSWMPGGQSVILRYENYATHLRDAVSGHPSGGNQVELYASCADVTVLPSRDSVPVSALTSVNIRRAQHLPNSNTKFPRQSTRMINGGPNPGDVFPPLACTGACLRKKVAPSSAPKTPAISETTKAVDKTPVRSETTKAGYIAPTPTSKTSVSSDVVKAVVDSSSTMPASVCGILSGVLFIAV